MSGGGENRLLQEVLLDLLLPFTAFLRTEAVFLGGAMEAQASVWAWERACVSVHVVGEWWKLGAGSAHSSVLTGCRFFSIGSDCSMHTMVMKASYCSSWSIRQAWRMGGGGWALGGLPLRPP